MQLWSAEMVEFSRKTCEGIWIFNQDGVLPELQLIALMVMPESPPNRSMAAVAAVPSMTLPVMLLA